MVASILHIYPKIGQGSLKRAPRKLKCFISQVAKTVVFAGRITRSTPVLSLDIYAVWAAISVRRLALIIFEISHTFHQASFQ